MRFTALSAIAFAAAVFATTVAAQQQTDNRVAAEADWSVFTISDPQTECWAVSSPKQSENTRDGRVVSVRRGEILLFVNYRPAESVTGEIAFTGGYPFADGSTVTLEIGDDTFELFTEGEWAWPASASDDSRIMTAMKRGVSAILTGRSARGTITKDTFSLLGFTATTEEAERRCAG